MHVYGMSPVTGLKQVNTCLILLACCDLILEVNMHEFIEMWKWFTKMKTLFVMMSPSEYILMPPNILCQVHGDHSDLWITVSNKPPDPLFWILLLLPDYPVQATRTSAMDSQQPLYHIHRAAIDEPGGRRGFWGQGPTYRCALWVALSLIQEASEKKTFFNFWHCEWAP